MFERELRLYAMMLKYCRKLTVDLTDEQIYVAPCSGANTPAWLLGHLAISADYGLQLVGRPTHCSAAWHKQFAPGSLPSALKAPGLKKFELMDTLEAGHARVNEAAAVTTLEQMAESHGLAFLRDSLPTKGDVMAHLLTTHEACHLGQLSAWRRQMGLPSTT